MTNAALSPLLDLARGANAEITDRWGKSSLTLFDGFDLDRLNELAEHDGYVVTAFLGQRRAAMRFDTGEPSPTELAEVAALAPNERVQSEILSATSSVEVLRLLRNEIVDVEVEYVRHRWARTTTGLRTSLADDWVGVADDLRAGPITVGDFTLMLRGNAERRTPTALPAVIVDDPRPEPADASEAWDALTAICDAAAWTNLADRVSRGDEIRVALHADQDPVVPVTLEASRGGAELFDWLTASKDSNRNEALRYVLRFVTASAPDRLPDATTVQKLAERQRIALSRDRAAEVQRAIADSHRDTMTSLTNASRELADVIDESNKATSATVVGVLGIIALVAKSPDALPAWLIVSATIAALLGVVAVLVSRHQRISDQETSLKRLLARIHDDPLLPDEDRLVAERSIADFDLLRRTKRARGTIIVLGAVSCALVIGAAIWLLDVHDAPTNSDRSPSSTTSTTR